MRGKDATLPWEVTDRFGLGSRAHPSLPRPLFGLPARSIWGCLATVTPRSLRRVAKPKPRKLARKSSRTPASDAGGGGAEVAPAASAGKSARASSAEIEAAREDRAAKETVLTPAELARIDLGQPDPDPRDSELPTDEALDRVHRRGEWPNSETARGAAFDRNWRPLIQALKFVPGYRQEWDDMKQAWGREALLETLKEYRRLVLRDAQQEAGKNEPPIDAAQLKRLYAVQALAVSFKGIDIGPVDPDDPKDFGLPPLPLKHLLDPWAMLGGGAAWPILEFSTQLPPASSLSPYLAVIIDLSRPHAEIKQDLDRLRTTYGVKATTRTSRKLGWDELELGFRLLQGKRTSPSKTLIQLATETRGATVYPARQDTERRVRLLLGKASKYVETMTAAHHEDRERGIPRPPIWGDCPP